MIGSKLASCFVTRVYDIVVSVSLQQHPSLKREMRVIFLCNEASSQQKVRIHSATPMCYASIIYKLFKVPLLDDKTNSHLCLTYKILVVD